MIKSDMGDCQNDRKMHSKKILIISGSYKKDGNTAALIGWFCAGAKARGIKIEIVSAAHLRAKIFGCTSCRKCQERKEYGCVIDDGISSALIKMIEADVIVFATPLYFFAASALVKAVMDRMFSLYKWDNDEDTFETPLRGKTLLLLASAYEAVGLDALATPFKLTADYTGMKFRSLLVPNAGVSGSLKKNIRARKQAIEFGKAFRKRGKLVGLLLAWLIIELLISPLKSTGMALAMGQKIGSNETAAATIHGPAIETRKMETRVFTLINRVRRKQGLNELKINNYLSSLARQHSLDMATGKSSFGHQGFESRTSLITRQIGAVYLAENVAYNEGYDDPANEAVADWLASPKHLINLKGEYKLTGVGVAIAGDGGYYYTQIFAR